MKNYRPVSNLSFISKILEKTVSSRLLDHIKSNNLGKPLQSAYTRHHGTETALLKIQSDLLLAMDDHKASLVVFLDLSAAFDTIDHTILVNRLRNDYGLCEKALDWLESYLTDRYQSVHIEDNSSEYTKLNFGVPQGSVLGPLLFSYYTKPIRAIAATHNLKIHLYADDTQLYVSFRFSSYTGAIAALCRVELNADKTEYLIVASPNVLPKITLRPINISGIKIEPSVSAKNSGVMFDKHLNMCEHVNQICGKAQFLFKKIGDIRNCLSIVTTEHLIPAYVTSQLDCCNSLLYGLPNSCILKLQRVQNSAARIIYRRKKFDHVTPLLKQLHWLPIRQRIHYKLFLLRFKAQHDLAPSYLQDCIIPYSPCRPLRTKHLLVVPPTKLKTYGDRSFNKAAPLLWNKLPYHIRSCNKLDQFKRHLKSHLFNIAYL